MDGYVGRIPEWHLNFRISAFCRVALRPRKSNCNEIMETAAPCLNAWVFYWQLLRYIMEVPQNEPDPYSDPLISSKSLYIFVGPPFFV